MFNFLTIPLKLVRKLNNFFHLQAVRYRIFSYRVLSENRFNFQRPYSIGKHFCITSDLSKNKLLVRSKLRARNNFNINLGKNGELTIGENCFFNNQCSITCLGKIEIGSNNQFGEAVLIYDHNHNFRDKTQLVSNQGYTIGKIKIGNNCWIGSHVVILKDVTIGDNVVIGAGCIIVKSIPANCVVMNQQNLLIKQKEIHDCRKRASGKRCSRNRFKTNNVLCKWYF